MNQRARGRFVGHARSGKGLRARPRRRPRGSVPAGARQAGLRVPATTALRRPSPRRRPAAPPSRAGCGGWARYGWPAGCQRCVLGGWGGGLCGIALGRSLLKQRPARARRLAGGVVRGGVRGRKKGGGLEWNRTLRGGGLGGVESARGGAWRRSGAARALAGRLPEHASAGGHSTRGGGWAHSASPDSVNPSASRSIESMRWVGGPRTP